MWWHSMSFIANHISCIPFGISEGQHKAIYHSSSLPFGHGQSPFRLKNQSMSCSVGCLSLFKSVLDLIKQFSLVVWDLKWYIFVTKNLNRRFLWTVLRIVASETRKSFAIDLIDFWRLSLMIFWTSWINSCILML